MQYPLRLRLLACGCLTTTQIISSTILKLSNDNGVYKFSPQSSLVLSEMIKLAFSLLYHFKDCSFHRGKQALVEQSSIILILHMCGLALIYCINNGIMFSLFARADPGSIALVKSGTTVISALMLYCVRGFQLSITRWSVVVIQMLGLTIAQYDVCTGKSHLPPSIYVLLSFNVFNSSLANVWNEYMIKSFERATMATKNVYLYLFGALFNMLIFLYTSRGPFFGGYGWMGICVVLSNGFMGIAMNLVYKYADAVVKTLATGCTTAVLVGMSAVWFGGRCDIMVFVGGCVVLLSTYLYFAIGTFEEVLEELRQLLEDKTDLDSCEDVHCVETDGARKDCKVV